MKKEERRKKVGGGRYLYRTGCDSGRRGNHDGSRVLTKREGT